MSEEQAGYCINCEEYNVWDGMCFSCEEYVGQDDYLFDDIDYTEQDSCNCEDRPCCGCGQ